MERYDIGITEEERRKCKKVVEAFEEYFELVDDEIILDTERFGILWLRGYFARAAEFGTQVFLIIVKSCLMISGKRGSENSC